MNGERPRGTRPKPDTTARSCQYTSIGGQAVLEGVMMRSPNFVATAVRRKDGSIQIRSDSFISIAASYPILKKPILRGVVNLIESLIVGVRSLSYSGELAAQDDEEGDGNKNGKNAEGKNSADGRPAPAASKLAIATSLFFAFVLGIALFVALPHGIAALITHPRFLNISSESPVFHLLDGLLKLLILIAYIHAIGRLPEIKRVFQYHGAEHQSIFAFEAERPLTVSEAARFSPHHPRCGTSFLLFLVLISVVLFSILLPVLGLTRISSTPVLNHLGMITAKIILMFPVAGLAYEFIKYSATRMNHPFFKAIILPGLKLQRLTTQKPDADQLEVALASLTQVLRLEKKESLPGEIRIRSLKELNPPAVHLSEYLEI